MSSHDEPLHPSVREELRDRYGSQTPRPELEDEIVWALRREGFLDAVAPPSRRTRAVAAVAALVVFVAGYAIGQRGAPTPVVPASDDGAVFVLFLREPIDAPVVAPGGEEAQVAEYAAWAREQAGAGRLLLGEKLSEARALVAARNAEPTVDDPTHITGLFLVRAADLEAARAIARTCPHVDYGGIIEVRPIEPT